MNHKLNPKILKSFFILNFLFKSLFQARLFESEKKNIPKRYNPKKDPTTTKSISFICPNNESSCACEYEVKPDKLYDCNEDAAEVSAK